MSRKEINTKSHFKAMASHVSQQAYKRGSRLINGDQIFWKRRTDNIALYADITVSSERLSISMIFYVLIR